MLCCRRIRSGDLAVILHYQRPGGSIARPQTARTYNRVGSFLNNMTRIILLLLL